MAALSCRVSVSHTLADQGTGEVEESRMVGHLALPAHQQPTAAVEPSVRPLNNPSACPLTLAFPLTHFLSPAVNMNPIAALLRLAGPTTRDKGKPLPSTSRERLTPCLPRSVGLRPTTSLRDSGAFVRQPSTASQRQSIPCTSS